MAGQGGTHHFCALHRDHRADGALVLNGIPWQVEVAQLHRAINRMHRHQRFDPYVTRQPVRCCACTSIHSGHGHGFCNRIHMFQSALAIPQLPIGITLVDLIRHLQRSDAQQRQSQHGQRETCQAQRIKGKTQVEMQAPVTHLRIHFCSGHAVHLGVVQQGVDLLRAQMLEQRQLDCFMTPVKLDRHIPVGGFQRVIQGAHVGLQVTCTDEPLKELDVPRQAKLLAQGQVQGIPGRVPGQGALRVIGDPAQYPLEYLTSGLLMSDFKRHRTAYPLTEYPQLHGPQP
ncbi:hypothetical protein D3C80_719820 [compost metagenome]